MRTIDVAVVRDAFPIALQSARPLLTRRASPIAARAPFNYTRGRRCLSLPLPPSPLPPLSLSVSLFFTIATRAVFAASFGIRRGKRRVGHREFASHVAREEREERDASETRVNPRGLLWKRDATPSGALHFTRDHPGNFTTSVSPVYRTRAVRYAYRGIYRNAFSIIRIVLMERKV
jgi:hypothetical protein